MPANSVHAYLKKSHDLFNYSFRLGKINGPKECAHKRPPGMSHQVGSGACKQVHKKTCPDSHRHPPSGNPLAAKTQE